jgi:hypothetical protein
MPIDLHPRAYISLSSNRNENLWYPKVVRRYRALNLSRDVASNVTGDTFIASASTSPLTTLWMDERGPLRDRCYLV